MADESVILPPIGFIGPDDHGQATIILNNLRKDSNDEGNFETPDGAISHKDRAQTNLTLYHVGTARARCSTDVVSNQGQDSVNAVVDYMTKEPAIWNCNTNQRGEPGKVYYFTPPQQDPQTGQMTPTQVLGPFTQDQAQQMQQPQVVGADAMGQPVQGPPAFNPANFVSINSQSTAEFAQLQLDVYRNRGRLDKSLRVVVHYGTIFGFLFPVFEWDMNFHRPKLWTDISLKDTYIDPYRPDIADSAYAGVDWWLDTEQAKTMFPHLSDIIDDRSRTGIPERPSSETSTQVPGGYSRRNTIILGVFWLRNQPCPYETDEALAAGLLERRMIPVYDPSAQIVNENQQFPKGAGDETTTLPSDAEGGQEANEMGVQPVGDEPASPQSVGTVGGDGVSGVVQTQTAPVRPALFAAGQEVTPPVKGDPASLHPAWPMYRCTRQITELLGIIVDDRECEYWDIPMLQMVSTPLPYTPYGQGLPERLEQMQDGRTQMLTAMRDHTELQAHPVSVIDQVAYDALPAEYKEEGASRAGMTIVQPHDISLALAGKAPTFFMNPPPMSEAVVDVEKIFHDEITERSGNPDVLQGTPPPGVTAGVSLQILSQNASSRFGFAQQGIRDMQERCAMLTLKCIADPKKVTPYDLAKVDRRYPPEICALFQKEMQMAEWIMEIDMQTGISSARNKKQAEAIQNFNLKDPSTGMPVLSTESLRDALDIDNKQEDQRNMQAQQQSMQLQQQKAALAQAMNPQPEPKQPSNGQTNGHASVNGRMSA